MRSSKNTKTIRTEAVALGTDVLKNCIAVSKGIYTVAEGEYRTDNLPTEQYEAFEAQMLQIVKRANIVGERLTDLIFSNKPFTMNAFDPLAREVIKLTTMAMEHGKVYLDIYLENPTRTSVECSRNTQKLENLFGANVAVAA